jgi:hypothetical protein
MEGATRFVERLGAPVAARVAVPGGARSAGGALLLLAVVAVAVAWWYFGKRGGEDGAALQAKKRVRFADEVDGGSPVDTGLVDRLVDRIMEVQRENMPPGAAARGPG